MFCERIPALYTAGIYVSICFVFIFSKKPAQCGY